MRYLKTYKTFESTNYQDQLEMGIKIESEHGDIFNELKDWVDENFIEVGMPWSEKEFYAKIAKSHLREMPDYYTKLVQMENESIMIQNSLDELEKLKKDLNIRVQRYVYLMESTLDLDPADREIVGEKLKGLQSHIDKSLDELKYNIWMEKESAEYTECKSGAYAIMTKELEDILNYNRMKDGYLFRFKSCEELEELKNQYPIGGSYNDEEIIDVKIFPEEI